MMNKKVKQRISVAIASVCALSCLSVVGCGTTTKVNDPNVLDIVMPDLGYGTDWMEALAADFTAKTGKKVEVDITPTEAGYSTSILAGTAEYDIYLIREAPAKLLTTNAANYSGYDPVLASLDDVYNSKVRGEDVLFKDKMKDIYEQYNHVDHKATGDYHYYSVQWCDTVFSLVRNLEVWKNEWVIPNTTDELLVLAEQIKNTDGGYTPFIWSAQATYWWQVANLWVTQYQGLEDMCGEKGFWNGYDEEGNQNVPEMWNRNGIYYALKVLDDLMNPENEYQHTLSDSVDFTTAQGYFCIPENKIAMMANGDWLYKEMVKNYSNAKLEMIQMPVVSGLIYHPDCENSIENDAELSALIKAIDASDKDAGLTGAGYSVTQKAFDKVYEARKMYTCGSQLNHIMISPAYSKSLDIVKEFYLYLASDEALKLYARSSGGFTLGFDTSDEVYAEAYKTANSFVKSSLDIKQRNQVAPWPIISSRLFIAGGMPVFPTIEMNDQKEPEKIFMLKPDDGRLTADEMFVNNYRNAKQKWSMFMQAAGLQ